MQNNLNVNIKMIECTPLKLAGYVKKFSPKYSETHFEITELEDGYLLEQTEGGTYSETFLNLQDAIKETYLAWGE